VGPDDRARLLIPFAIEESAMTVSSKNRQAGVTLLELTVALAIFMLLMGAAAQALVSYYVALDLQNQRNIATQHCRTVLSDMRSVRDDNGHNFPAAITETWPDEGAVAIPGQALTAETLTVTYEDPAANPLVVTATCSWLDKAGHRASVQVATVISDQ
jgi:type II secretory pathway pseudopilin PulG